MKAIMLLHRDHTQRLAFMVPVDFDTQRWADRNAGHLRLLDVIKVVEVYRG